MCLSKVFKIEPVSMGIGFKVTKTNPFIDPIGQFYCWHKDKNGWFKNVRISDIYYGSNRQKSYPPGFHIYTSISSAIDHMHGDAKYLVIVKYKEAHTLGMQEHDEVIVANYIKPITVYKIIHTVNGPRPYVIKEVTK